MDVNAERARMLVRLARLAYRDADAAESGAAALGLTGFSFFDGSSTQAFVADDATHTYLAFRGTETNRPVDWTRDAQFHPVRGEFGATVHSGFHAALDEVWVDVSARVAAEARPVLVTGHSLGAALATLAAARLHEERRQVAGVVTFGQPRTGHGGFKSEFDRRLRAVTYRFVNHIDLVTRVPLLVQRYRHVGRRMYFDAAGTFHADAGNWHVALDDLRYRLRHFGRISSIGLAPHSIGRYDELVQRM